MTTKQDIETKRDLDILEQIETNPDSTQATLAAHLNAAVGTVNWHIKRLVDKGYVKIQRCERRKLKYLITPEGLALRSRLTLDYINTSFELYRTLRMRMSAVLDRCEGLPVRTISIKGSKDDVEEICRLTCLERGWKTTDCQDPAIPHVEIIELKLFLTLPEGENE